MPFILFALSIPYLITGNWIRDFRSRNQGADSLFYQVPGPVVSPNVIKRLSLGYWSAFLNFRWILAFQKLDGRNSAQAHDFFQDMNLMTDLDPYFFEAYSSGAQILSVALNSPDLAIHILNKAVWHSPPIGEKNLRKFWKNEWSLFMTIGSIYLFEKGDLRRASAAFQRAAEFENAPDFLSRLSQRLQTPEGEREVGAQLREFLRRAYNERSGS